MLVAHYSRIYRPEGGRITVLGDISAREITPKLEKLLADWKGAGTEAAGAARCLAPIKGRKVILVDRPELGADRVLSRQPRDRPPAARTTSPSRC